MKTISKVNSLKHSISVDNKKGNYLINIKLADECNNGYNDFSITATFWKKGMQRNDRAMITAGCCHDEILKVHPELKQFIDLHLCNAKGVPMYAIDNGFYHLKESGISTAKDYLRLTASEVKIISQAQDKQHFKYLLNELNVPSRWEYEAKEAIKTLESLTGLNFEDNSIKLETALITESEKREVESKLKEGYYSPEAIEARRKKAIDDKKQALIQDLKDSLDKKIKEKTEELNVRLAVIDAGLSIENMIYYNHRNELVFNWLDYQKKVTESEFNQFVHNVNTGNLPTGIKFTLGTKGR